MSMTTDQFKARLAGTHPGQADFAGEGPRETCRTCQHWTGSDLDRWRAGKVKGLLKPAACGKYAELIGLKPGKCPKIPEQAKACRYHIGNPEAPAIRRADK